MPHFWSVLGPVHEVEIRAFVDVRFDNVGEWGEEDPGAFMAKDGVEELTLRTCTAGHVVLSWNSDKIGLYVEPIFQDYYKVLEDDGSVEGSRRATFNPQYGAPADKDDWDTVFRTTRLWAKAVETSAIVGDIHLTLSPVTAQAPPDVLNLTILSADLDIDGVSDADEETVGGFVPVNGDNDNGSALTDRIPATRDFDASGYADDDLVPISLSLQSVAGLSGSVRLRKVEGGGDRIRVWESTGKTSEVSLPKTWMIGIDTIPATLHVEGLKEGQALRDVELVLEYMQSGSVACADNVTVTVTPVLEDLKVTAASGSDPDLVDDPLLGNCHRGRDIGSGFYA